MLNSFKLRLLNEKEERIYDAHAIVGESHVRISYGYKTNDGLIEFRNIILANATEYAPFFKKHKFIDKYAFIGDNVKMYKFAKIHTWTNKGIMEATRPFEVTLEDIEDELNPSVCLTLCAVHELPIKDIVDDVMRYFIKTGVRYASMFM